MFEEKLNNFVESYKKLSLVDKKIALEKEIKETLALLEKLHQNLGKENTILLNKEILDVKGLPEVQSSYDREERKQRQEETQQHRPHPRVRRSAHVVRPPHHRRRLHQQLGGLPQVRHRAQQAHHRHRPGPRHQEHRAVARP